MKQFRDGKIPRYHPNVAASPLRRPLGSLNAGMRGALLPLRDSNPRLGKCCASPSCRTGLSVGDPDSLAALIGRGLRHCLCCG